MKYIISIFFSSLLALPVQARDVAGIEMPETIDAGGTALTLSGAGIRKKMFMDIYAGGLYLVDKSIPTERIVAADESMAIRLHMVSGLVSSEAMEEATRDGFDNATDGNIASISNYIEEFIAVFREPIVEGDVFEIVYVPTKGMSIFKNGGYIKTVSGGLPFKQSTFAIWLGDEPADNGLKRAMLER
ncbi:MAG: chalcone isomerase family protein [Halioglobus sp.]